MWFMYSDNRIILYSKEYWNGDKSSTSILEDCDNVYFGNKKIVLPSIRQDTIFP